jgi:hypothetical protein
MAAVYSPSDIKLMCQVLDLVYGKLAQRGYSNVSREIIAERILKCVADGERDLAILADSAMSEPIEPHSTMH